MEYNINHDLSIIHKNFNNECNVIDLSNFKSNPSMKEIVQNCSNSSGLQHKNFIIMNYLDIYKKIDFEILKKYDLIGGHGKEALIDGLTPKVFSYLKEAILFYDKYLKEKNITEIRNLLIFGGGYGMEAAILYHICSLVNIKVHKITGIDMDNVSKLQNMFFKECQIDNICKCYNSDYTDLNIDIVYSNCCLAELTNEINYNYWNNYISNSNGFYIVWGLWCADIPSYYKKYEDTILDDILNDGLRDKRVNCLFLK